ncbi:hypothetical protein ABK040_014538 [Willaertia magna]
MEFRMLSPEATISSRSDDYEVGLEECFDLPQPPLFQPINNNNNTFNKDELFDLCIIGCYGAGSQFLQSSILSQTKEQLTPIASITINNNNTIDKNSNDNNSGNINNNAFSEFSLTSASNQLKKNKKIEDLIYLYKNKKEKTILFIDSGNVILQPHHLKYDTIKETHQQAYLTYLYTKCLLENINAKRFIILDSILVSEYQYGNNKNYHISPPLVKMLRTNKDKQIFKEESESQLLPEYLESPNLMSGLAANLLTNLEQEGKCGLLFCSLEENHALEPITMKAFEKVVFGLLLKTAEEENDNTSPLSKVLSTPIKYKRDATSHHGLYL